MARIHQRMHRLATILLLTPLAIACSSPPRGPARDTVLVFAAASLAAPARALLDTFARRTGALVQEEHGGSMELARRVTELHRVPDVMVLADHEVIRDLLMPAHAGWYARFGRDRMVVAYTGRSRHAAEVNGDNWWRILLGDDVLVGRTDPALAPAGYRALLTFALAERALHEPGLAGRLAARSPRRLQRGNASELAALLEAGELDYIVDYESLARAHHFRWVTLSPDIDLGDASRAAVYAAATVRVPGGRDSVTRHGAPILDGVTVPRDAPHRAAGERFAALLLGAEGRAILRAAGLDALDHVELVGDSVPVTVRTAADP